MLLLLQTLTLGLYTACTPLEPMSRSSPRWLTTCWMLAPCCFLCQVWYRTLHAVRHNARDLCRWRFYSLTLTCTMLPSRVLYVFACARRHQERSTRCTDNTYWQGSRE